MIWRVLQLFIIIGLTVAVQAQEPVREQLKHQQEQEGLTLATFDFGEFKTIEFASRSFKLRSTKVNSKGGLEEGVVSRDGEKVAFHLSFGHPYREYLAIARSDGSGLEEYPSIISPSFYCWSNDKSRLALNAAAHGQHHGELLVIDLNSKATDEIESGAHVTSQCWSPDDKQIVYGVGNRLRIYDLGEKKSRELAEGTWPTWSPDGNWIAFYAENDHAYFAIRPSGGERKRLFKQKGTRTGLWWSPDCNVVAYMCLGGKHESHRDFDFPTRQLRVRRVADNSDDWILAEPDVAYVPNYQWVLPVESKSK